MKKSLNEIAILVNGVVEGDGEAVVSGLGKIEDSVSGVITFLSNPKYDSFLEKTKATAVLLAKDYNLTKKIRATVIRVENPYVAFTVLLEEYQKAVFLSKTGVEPNTFLHESALVGNDVYRGFSSYIGESCVIGNKVKIYPHVFIDSNVEIGEGTILYSGVKIYKDTIIGKDCVIHSNAVIGADGFGFAPQSDGSYRAIPQLGKVVLEDNVSIGANTTIDRATLGSTIIRKGVKIDNLVQVAHNVEVGEHTVIAAQAGISGSAKIGKYCQVGGQAGIGGHLTIGDKVVFGAQAGTIQDVTSNKVMLGSPAIEMKNYFRSYALFRKLPDFKRKIDDLEEKIVNLPTV